MQSRRIFILKLEGFSLIEILVVAGILTILVSVAMFASMDFYRTYAFTSVRNELLTAFTKARNQSMANINQANHGVKILNSPTRLVIYQGGSYNTRDTSLDEIINPSSIANFTGMSEANFSQLSGNATITGGGLTFSVGPKLGNLNVNSEGTILW